MKVVSASSSPGFIYKRSSSFILGSPSRYSNPVMPKASTSESSLLVLSAHLTPPTADKGRPTAGKAKAIAYPTAGKKMKKDFGVPKFTALKDAIANNRAGQMVRSGNFVVNQSLVAKLYWSTPPAETPILKGKLG